MSATTYQHARDEGLFAGVRKALSVVMRRMMESRMRQAERHVAYHLLTMDDRTLAELGYSRADLIKKNPVPRGL
jgi:hypothetical protein